MAEAAAAAANDTVNETRTRTFNANVVVTAAECTVTKGCTGELVSEHHPRVVRGEARYDYRHKCDLCGQNAWLPTEYPKVTYAPAANVVDEVIERLRTQSAIVSPGEMALPEKEDASKPAKKRAVKSGGKKGAADAPADETADDETAEE